MEFVERGEFDAPQVQVLAERLLAPAIEAKVDTLLLGCTHYPYLARTISDVMGSDVVLVSSADETAFEVRRAATPGPHGCPRAADRRGGHVHHHRRRELLRGAGPHAARPGAGQRRAVTVVNVGQS